MVSAHLLSFRLLHAFHGVYVRSREIFGKTIAEAPRLSFLFIFSCHRIPDINPRITGPFFVGTASAPQKYYAILRFARGFLRYPDPFCLAIDGEDAHVKALGVLSSAASSAAAGRSMGSPSRQPVADGSRDNGTGGKTPYAGRGKSITMRK